jgi:hypothetical protein
MRRLADLALRAYPLAYRRRYGEEMRALLDEVPADGRTVVDLFRGAVIAHLRPAPGCRTVGEDRLRLSAAGVLACWTAFAVAGLAFYKTVEGHAFSAAGDAHPVLGGSYLAVQVAAVVASLAVLVGATPFVVSALRLRVPLRKILFATAVPPRALRLAVAAGVVVTAAMAAIAVAVAVCAISLSGLALAGEGNGPGGLVSVELSIVVELVAMAVPAGLAALSSARGLSSLTGRTA